MGGKSAPATTTQTTEVKLPAWVDAASQENYNLAKTVADRPLTQYEGKMVASPGAMTNQAYDVIGKSVGSTNPMISEAGDMFRKSAGPLDIAGFINPYTDLVESRTIDNMNRSLTKNLQGVNDKARAAKAFGGSRAAIERGVTRDEGTRSIGDFSAQLRKMGFDTASSLALADRGKYATAGQGLLSTAGAQKGAEAQDITTLLGAGAQQQGQEQAEIDALMKKFYEKRDYPLEGLNTRLAALGMSPYGKTETVNKTSTAEKQGTDWATVGLGAMKMLMPLMMMSDRDTKTDIKFIGKDKKSGLKMYAYRYKGDPKSYPKVVGPMAQDIAKKHPKTVEKIAGKQVVNLENLMEVLS